MTEIDNIADGQVLTTAELTTDFAKTLSSDGSTPMLPGATLTLGADPTQPLHAATMRWVQNGLTAAVSGLIGNTTGTFADMISAQGGLDVSVTRDWSGGTNNNDANPTQGGIGGVQRFYGTVAATTQSYGGSPLNEILILDSLNAGLAGGVDGFNISMISSGTACLGARTALQSTLTIACPTGNTGGEYSGFEAYCIASGNDNGTALAPSGGIFGINTVAQLGGSCTYWGSAVGYELDISVAAGASVQSVFGLHVCTLSPHAVNGSLDDIAVHISGSGGSAYWETGFGFGANTKPKAFGPASTLIKAYPDVFAPTTPLAVLNGIDFRMLAPSGFVLASPGFTLGNVGQIAQTITSPGPSSLATVPNSITFSPTADRGAGGYTGMSAEVIAGTISQNPDNSGSRFNTEFESVQLTIQSTSAAGSIGHSAVGTHVTKQLPTQANGTVYTMGTADTLPACWSLYGTAVDTSGLPTSKAGPLACQEYDMQVNAIDDAGGRGGYAFNADTKLPIASGGTPATVAQGFYSFGLNDTWIWCAHRAAGNHIMAAHDCRAIIGPETTVSVASTGTTVAVTNVTPYTIGSNDTGTGVLLKVSTIAVLTTQSSASETVAFADGFYPYIDGALVSGTDIVPGTTVTSSNSSTGVVVLSEPPSAALVAGTEITFTAQNPIYNVKIGGNTYQVSAATQGAPGTRSGTLTLSTALQGTDGAAGNTVARPFYALIMRTGDSVGYDINGNCRAFYDSGILGGAGGVHHTFGALFDGNIATGPNSGISAGLGGLSTTGGLQVDGGANVEGLIHATGTGGITSDDGINCAGGYLQLSAFTAALLPPAQYAPDDALLWCSDGLNPGETPGSGTGITVTRTALVDGVANWRRFDNTVASATIQAVVPIFESIGTIAAVGTSEATAAVVTTQSVIVTSGTGWIRLSYFGEGAKITVRNRIDATITVCVGPTAQIESLGTGEPVTLGPGLNGIYEPSGPDQWYY